MTTAALTDRRIAAIRSLSKIANGSSGPTIHHNPRVPLKVRINEVRIIDPAVKVCLVSRS